MTRHRVVVLALDGVYPFELGIPNRVFGSANDLYEVVTCTVDGQAVKTDADFTVGVDYGPEILETADTVIIPPFDLDTIAEELPTAVAEALAKVPAGTRVVSICTGAFALAAAGLLEGRTATTHWALAARFRELHPDIDLEPNVLFIDDGDILTAAGAAAGMDVCLHILRTDHGAKIANQVARLCVVPPWRDGGQAQFINTPIPEMEQTSTSEAREWALQNLHLPLSLAELAGRARMSKRTFARKFLAEVGESPGRWLIRARVARAKDLLESSDLPIEGVATQVGFATSASLRQHFHAEVGLAPMAYRRTYTHNQQDNLPVSAH